MIIWRKFPIRILLQVGTNEIVRSAAFQAIKEWQAVFPKYVEIKTLYRPHEPSKPTVKDQFSSIYFADRVPVQNWAWCPLVTDGNEIITGDIELSTQHPYTDFVGARRIILHEFGHFLGFPHNLETNDAIMSPKGPATINEIRPADVAMMLRYYPRR